MPQVAIVPNVPGGVESWEVVEGPAGGRATLFLMYRVELKDFFVQIIYMQIFVPNVPCGVERKPNALAIKGDFPQKFLMYRVELKG